jgi:hypothetical protein
LEKIVSCVKHIRDMLPAYTLCAEDGGKGIKASEGDLQEELFRTLKIEFGRRASYEHTHIGGGRSDTGVGFPEIFFPIEVKHEFRSIERMHIRDNYLIQPDLYASATDRIAFLLILDLRHSNNAGHRKRSAQRKAGEGEGDSPVSLYHLAESFWVDSLPTDPQVPTASPNAIVVGLVPGNRPRPSSTTKYSKRTSVE